MKSLQATQKPAFSFVAYVHNRKTLSDQIDLTKLTLKQRIFRNRPATIVCDFNWNAHFCTLGLRAALQKRKPAAVAELKLKCKLAKTRITYLNKESYMIFRYGWPA